MGEEVRLDGRCVGGGLEEKSGEVESGAAGSGSREGVRAVGEEGFEEVHGWVESGSRSFWVSGTYCIVWV
jgi:hypothetical protein